MPRDRDPEIRITLYRSESRKEWAIVATWDPGPRGRVQVFTTKAHTSIPGDAYTAKGLGKFIAEHLEGWLA